MKKTLKLIFIMLLYKAVIDKRKALSDGKIKFNFKMYPRTLNIIVIMFLTSPLLILLVGLRGLKEVFVSTNKVESWSSYEIVTNGEEPSLIAMYKKW
jgi:hypothetical protein